MDAAVDVEVVYAKPERQLIIRLRAPTGTTARQAAELSRLDAHFDELDVKTCPLGIFGKVVEDDHVLQANDRVELYRPLLADPKDVRRELAKQGKTMGKPRNNPR